MTYSESAKGIGISRKRADREVRDHGIDPNDADWQEWANSQQFPIDASKVLEWLGY